MHKKNGRKSIGVKIANKISKRDDTSIINNMYIFTAGPEKQQSLSRPGC